MKSENFEIIKIHIFLSKYAVKDIKRWHDIRNEKKKLIYFIEWKTMINYFGNNIWIVQNPHCAISYIKTLKIAHRNQQSYTVFNVRVWASLWLNLFFYFFYSSSSLRTILKQIKLLIFVSCRMYIAAEKFFFFLVPNATNIISHFQSRTESLLS